MVCTSCKHAGNENAAGNPKIAKLLHRNCDGRCDCQHVVGRTALAGLEPK